ncbi:MAG: alpha/beta fold hydrolase [Hyphomonadaceae bacterium]
MISLCLGLAALCACASAQQAAPPSMFTVAPCERAIEGLDTECGTVSVPEDYANPEGRRIALSVVVIRAAEAARPRRAIFELEGGPGFGVTDNAGDYSGFLAPLRRRSDIVLFDMRGTGRSNPLVCTALDAERARNRNGPLYPPELIEACAAEIAPRAEARHYTTANAARDIDSVRRALGYERIDLNAGSYGSTLALSYISLYPEHVRSAWLSGLAPASAMPPRAHAIGAQRALLMYIDACAREPTCAAAFPDLRGDLERVRARLSAPDAPFAFEIFMERLRERMYQPGPARRLPLVIHRAAQGDFSGFMSAPPGGSGRTAAHGLYLSITCAESFPYFDYETAARASRETYFNDYRLRRQRAACDVWRVPPAPVPVPRTHADIPVVLLSGDFDPATPPDWAIETQAHFPVSRHILVAQGGHGAGGLTNLDCLTRLQAAFYDTRDPAALDASCVAEIARPPFELE